MNEDVRKKYLEELMQPHIPLRVLQEIRQEIETEYNKYRNMSDKWDERANGIGTALEIIDKHIKEIEGEDLGDYPNTIEYQFDNMTGSTNL